MTPEEIAKIKHLQTGLFLLANALGQLLREYPDNMTVRDAVAQRCLDAAEVQQEVADILRGNADNEAEIVRD